MTFIYPFLFFIVDLLSTDNYLAHIDIDKQKWVDL